MALNPFQAPTDPIAATVRFITNTVTRQGRLLLESYEALRAHIYENEDNLTPEQIYMALGADTADLHRLAVLTKTFINTYIPGTIDDEVPEGEFIFPGPQGPQGPQS